MKLLICDDGQHYPAVLKAHVQAYMEQRRIEHSIDVYTDPQKKQFAIRYDWTAGFPQKRSISHILPKATVTQSPYPIKPLGTKRRTAVTTGCRSG